MMHHATKRGFKDCPGFLNSTGRLGAKRGRKRYVTLAFSGVPNKGGQNQKSKPTLRVTMMPLGAPSITKYGSLVRPDAQIVALRAHCARTALKAPPKGLGFALTFINADGAMHIMEISKSLAWVLGTQKSPA